MLSTALAQKDREIIESQLRLYASRYEAGGLPALTEEVQTRHKETLFVRVAGPANQTVFQSMPAQWDDFNPRELETRAVPRNLEWSSLAGGGDEGEVFKDPDHLEILSVRLPDGSFLQVGKSTEARDDVLEYFQGVSAVVMIAVLGIGLLGGTSLARRSLRPVRDLGRVLRSIGQTGKLDARVPTRGTGDELDELAELSNALLARIEALVTGMRETMDTIAHDLRTPMTRLRGAAEMALRSHSDTETYKQALADCLEEAEQAQTTLNALMDVAEAETGAMKLDLEEVHLAPLIASVVGLYEHVAEEKGVTIHPAVSDGLRLPADAKRLRQAVANLLDNAVKYTPPGGRIEINARSEGQQVVVSVRDTGLGIPPQELPRIWDRLYRGEAGRSQRGLGLGLSLVRAVARAHKGSVRASSEPGQGSEFTIALPAGSPG